MAYGQPILIKNDKIALLSQVEALNESTVQELAFKYPSCLPISEIDESFNPVLPVCTELHTSVGALDIVSNHLNLSNLSYFESNSIALFFDLPLEISITLPSSWFVNTVV